jgi:hypothetical protein
MKKILFASIVLSAFQAGATVYTVSNDPAKPAQYSSPTTALAAAAAGDTLYIYGSPNSYGQFEINKNITVIGAGFNTRKDIFYKTVFTYVDLTGTTRNGVVIDGIFCQYFRIQPGTTINYSNITLRNLIVSGGFSGISGSGVGCGSSFSNWLIDNCYIYQYTEPVTTSCNPISPATTGFLIKNSLLGTMSLSYNTTFINCQFGLDPSSAFGFNNQIDNTFNNSIFFRMNFSQLPSNVNNQFNNCLTYQTQSPSSTFDLNSWTGGASGSANNCIINQDPMWVNSLSFTLFTNNTPSIRNGWNPVLNAGSPAINAGTDNLDIGLTGGSVPYNYLAEPKIPVIRKYQLVNAVVPPSGTVTVNATATKAQ